MSVDQPSDLGDVLLANRASLNRLCFKHAESYESGFVESSTKMKNFC